MSGSYRGRKYTRLKENSVKAGVGFIGNRRGGKAASYARGKRKEEGGQG